MLDLVLTFRAQQCGRALQEVSDLLQRPSVLPAVDAALGVVATGRGGGALLEGEAVVLGVVEGPAGGQVT